MRFRWRHQLPRLLLLGIITVLIIAVYTAIFQLPNDCDRKLVEKENEVQALRHELESIQAELHGDSPSWGRHKLCLLVPFRDRFDELEQFVPHMHSYLNLKTVRHRIMVINQHDMLRFNRASLINAGFLLSEPHCDYIAMHDVDLLPLNPQLDYSYPEKGPYHVASPKLHPKYHYKTFVGGILLLTNDHFRKTNGLSNKFWGWGREDDEFYLRMVSAELQIFRPENMTTDHHNTFKHLHDREKRRRDYGSYGEQKKVSRRRDHYTGLDTVQYEVLSEREVRISGAPCHVYDIQLYCDLNQTPWCVHPDQLDRLMKDTAKANAFAQQKVEDAQHKMKNLHKDIKDAQQGIEDARSYIKLLHNPEQLRDLQPEQLSELDEKLQALLKEEKSQDKIR